jgi:multiple sugar transport system substrate-binding protein
MSRRVAVILLVLAAGTAGLTSALMSDDPSRYVVFSTWGTPAEIESFQRLVDRFNATRHPDHPVRLSHAEQYQYTERLMVQAAAGNLPDIVHLDRKDLPLFVRRGLLQDLNRMAHGDAAIDSGRFLPGLFRGCVIEGILYAVPHNYSTLVLYYNRDHFDAEGLAYPDSTWTWQTLVEASKRLVRRNADGSFARYGCLMQIAFPVLPYQNGGSVLNAAMDSCVIGSPEATEAMQYAVDLSEKHHVSWNMLAQNLQWDDLFAGGKLSMIANGRWAAASYARSVPAVDVAPLPRGKLRRGAATVHVMALSAHGTRKKEAWEFLKFLVSEEGQAMVNEAGANIPTLRSVALSDGFLRHHLTPAMKNRVFVDELSGCTGWPYEQGPYVTAYVLQSQMELAFRRVHLGEMTVKESFRRMEEDVNGLIRAQQASPEPRRFTGSVSFFVLVVLIAAGGILAIRARGRRGDMTGRLDVRGDAKGRGS